MPSRCIAAPTIEENTVNLKFIIIISMIVFSLSGCRLLPRENGPRQGAMQTLNDVQYAQISLDTSTMQALIIAKQ